jgi:hypothetical protein
LTEPRARALVDRTVGELARLQAGLGHTEELAALLDDIGDRPVSGPATEAVQAARETLGAPIPSTCISAARKPSKP